MQYLTLSLDRKLNSNKNTSTLVLYSSWKVSNKEHLWLKEKDIY